MPERSSFSFNERAWEAWDPWAGASVSEPAAPPPPWPPPNLTFGVFTGRRKKQEGMSQSEDNGLTDESF